jgi:hypothetical protein
MEVMSKMNNELNKLPYAQWLETALRYLIAFPVRGICINAVDDDGNIYTNYYKITMHDKLAISGSIQQDAMLDTLRANEYIKDEELDEE